MSLNENRGQFSRTFTRVIIEKWSYCLKSLKTIAKSFIKLAPGLARARRLVFNVKESM